ncbi:cupin domain-containing protein [Dictyobacter arantiisoli]|uniref:Cupin 2 conserved barrel domain-containing protein n=1 Tax=Dictyobacter arantiisoli TaxID=2014874 RepID=A0A5A5TCT5_9CHLR|nr:cupin [Dictyobacter arantiisoli]GCF09262.1 hypothetical protein KDI_28260 [Dictyobacter arantiisoli]
MQITRWNSPTPPQEQELRQKMHELGLNPYLWSNAAGDTYTPHTHSYDKVLYCVRGSIRFTLPDQLDVYGHAIYANLASGDCMILPAGTRHSAQVGPQGVTCMEAARAPLITAATLLSLHHS